MRPEQNYKKRYGAGRPNTMVDILEKKQKRQYGPRPGNHRGGQPVFGNTDREREAIALILAMRRTGKHPQAIADELTRAGVPARLGAWSRTTVRRILARHGDPVPETHICPTCRQMVYQYPIAVPPADPSQLELPIKPE